MEGDGQQKSALFTWLFLSLSLSLCLSLSLSVTLFLSLSVFVSVSLSLCLSVPLVLSLSVSAVSLSLMRMCPTSTLVEEDLITEDAGCRWRLRGRTGPTAQRLTQVELNLQIGRLLSDRGQAELCGHSAYPGCASLCEPGTQDPLMGTNVVLWTLSSLLRVIR